jgi:uncharacterized membrane protein
MRKLISIAGIALLSMLIISYSPAHADEGHGRDTKEIIEEIFLAQNINDVDEVNCSQVANHQYEELGDAVMTIMHPDDDEHELMDNMMGGEGSKSLEAMHISMGRKYLGCWNSNLNYGRYEMMGGRGIMNFDGNDFGGMMWGASSGTSNTTVLLVVAVLTIGLVLGFGILFILLNRNTNPTSLSILSNRLARGEIDQKAYNKLKKEISI